MAGTNARFVHPSEFGISTPINTQAELSRIARAINGTPEKMTKEQLKKKIAEMSNQLKDMK